MAFYDKFPYTNFQEINLDKLIIRMLQLELEQKEFINNNVIKYADPIQWNITTQYEANTVVVDSDGNAYISSQPVPAGVSISNTDYWSRIGNFSELWETVKKAITQYDEEQGTTATVAHSENDLVWLSDDLIVVTRPMLPGDAYVIGSNCEYTSINDELEKILQQIEKPDTIYNRVQDMLNASALIAGMYVNTRGFYEPGDGGGACYFIDVAGTIDNITTFITAGGLYAKIQLPENGAVDIRTLGCKTDASNDISDAINAVTYDHAVYIPTGRYLVTHQINLKNNMFGDVANRYSLSTNKASKIYSSVNNDDGATINISGTVPGITIKDLEFIATDTAEVIYFHPANDPMHLTVENVKFTDFQRTAINVSPQYPASRPAVIKGCTFLAKPWSFNSIGIYFSNHAFDCMIESTEIMQTRTGVEGHNTLIRCDNMHLWCSCTGTNADKQEWWRDTTCFKLYTARLIATNLYTDSARFPFWDATGKSQINVTGFLQMCDSTPSDIPQYHDGTLVYQVGTQRNTYYFSDGAIYCDPYHSNMFKDGEDALFNFTNMKFIMPSDTLPYATSDTKYMTPSMYQLNLGSIRLSNNGSTVMAIMQYMTTYACSETYLLTGSYGESAYITITKTGITKTIVSGSMTIYYKDVAAGNDTARIIYVPSGRYTIQKVNGTAYARTKIYATFTNNNVPFVAYTQSDTSGLTAV